MGVNFREEMRSFVGEISIYAKEANSDFVIIPQNGIELVSINGEEEDHRYYWQPGFNSNPPDWLSGPNPDWPGNYKVKYWLDSWKTIIYGNNEAYLDKLVEAGFDGAYLDIIDGYEYFEDLI